MPSKIGKFQHVRTHLPSARWNPYPHWPHHRHPLLQTNPSPLWLPNPKSHTASHHFPIPKLISHFHFLEKQTEKIEVIKRSHLFICNNKGAVWRQNTLSSEKGKRISNHVAATALFISAQDPNPSRQQRLGSMPIGHRTCPLSPPQAPSSPSLLLQHHLRCWYSLPSHLKRYFLSQIFFR